MTQTQKFVSTSQLLTFIYITVTPFDWKMAQEEVMQASNDPIQDAIARYDFT